MRLKLYTVHCILNLSNHSWWEVFVHCKHNETLRMGTCWQLCLVICWTIIIWSFLISISELINSWWVVLLIHIRYLYHILILLSSEFQNFPRVTEKFRQRTSHGCTGLFHRHKSHRDLVYAVLNALCWPPSKKWNILFFFIIVQIESINEYRGKYKYRV